jgi:hypothetical protein
MIKGNAPKKTKNEHKKNGEPGHDPQHCLLITYFRPFKSTDNLSHNPFGIFQAFFETFLMDF